MKWSLRSRLNAGFPPPHRNYNYAQSKLNRQNGILKSYEMVPSIAKTAEIFFSHSNNLAVCLSLSVQVDDGWCEGTKKNGKMGMFPDNFVKLRPVTTPPAAVSRPAAKAPPPDPTPSDPPVVVRSAGPPSPLSPYLNYQEIKTTSEKGHLELPSNNRHLSIKDAFVGPRCPLFRGFRLLRVCHSQACLQCCYTVLTALPPSLLSPCYCEQV